MMSFLKQVVDAVKKAAEWVVSFDKKVIQWVKEKILWVKNKFSDE